MKTRDLIFISMFTALAVAGAFLRIPLPFLSITFQMLFALMAGIILGPSRGMAAMVIYMFLGLAGLPVFSMGGGLGYVTQPSFGFIIAFIPGAFISGSVYNRLNTKPYLKTLLSFSAGTVTVYVIGILYMYLILKFYLDRTETALLATVLSMLPYIAKDFVLALMASSMGRYIPLLRKFSS